ncbi:MAG: fused MFS/spermidine synthase [Myxococcales bacterium]|nr:fused MFS/spermidine synthase [Myxococcales bacterium]
MGIGVLAAILVVADVGLSLRESEGLIWRERSFFGVLRVMETGDGDTRQRLLRHGSTAHGLQFLEPPKMRFPTSYYGRVTPLGAWMFMRAPESKRRIGVVGLGVGTIAAYGRPGDLIRFYEIDPGVVHVAGPDGLYRYLSDSAATVEVELGDARLALEEEQAEGRRQDFDLLVIDAFSSDSIPAHLMTQEAFEGYRAALADSGMIAVHVSNRHLQLKNVVSRLFGSIGFSSVHLSTYAVPRYQSKRTDWVFASERPVQLIDLQIALGKLHQRFHLGENSYQVSRLRSSELGSIPL